MKDDSGDMPQEERGYSSFHSEEVQEIMEQQPMWILRWGITMLIIILLLIGLACWGIKYPQTVKALISLTTDSPPIDLVARVSGNIEAMFVVNSGQVRKGQLLAIIESTANYADILAVESYLYSSKYCQSQPLLDAERWEKFNLGNIQSALIDFLETYKDYEDYLLIDQIGRKVELLKEQTRRAKDYYHKLELQREILVEELQYEQSTIKSFKILLERKAIAQAEYDEAMKVYISKKSTLAGFDATMSSALLSRLQIEQQIIELETQKTTEMAKFERNMTQRRSNLLSQIALWKEQYTIVAPKDGIISLQNVWSDGQRIKVGDIVASIIPIGEVNIIGRLKVPSSGFGKVACGQEVNIKLSGFPFFEFGILKGTVKSISSVPEIVDNFGLCYTVNVELTDGLESSYHKTFQLIHGMDGTAEILTDDMRLIESFVQPIKSLFVNR